MTHLKASVLDNYLLLLIRNWMAHISTHLHIYVCHRRHVSMKSNKSLIERWIAYMHADNCSYGWSSPILVPKCLNQVLYTKACPSAANVSFQVSLLNKNLLFSCQRVSFLGYLLTSFTSMQETQIQRQEICFVHCENVRQAWEPT